jgi:hypothetical protein
VERARGSQRQRGCSEYAFHDANWMLRDGGTTEARRAEARTAEARAAVRGMTPRLGRCSRSRFRIVWRSDAPERDVHHRHQVRRRLIYIYIYNK